MIAAICAKLISNTITPTPLQWGFFTSERKHMEPTSSAVSAGAALGAVAITSMMPGVNGDALIGAFSGAVVFALYTKDVRIVKRLIYMLVSFVMGYLAAPEVMHWTGIQSDVFAAFVASALIVTTALAGIEKIKSFDISQFRKRG